MMRKYWLKKRNCNLLSFEMVPANLLQSCLVDLVVLLTIWIWQCGQLTENLTNLTFSILKICQMVPRLGQFLVPESVACTLEVMVHPDPQSASRASNLFKEFRIQNDPKKLFIFKEKFSSFVDNELFLIPWGKLCLFICNNCTVIY